MSAPRILRSATALAFFTALVPATGCLDLLGRAPDARGATDEVRETRDHIAAGVAAFAVQLARQDLENLEHWTAEGVRSGTFRETTTGWSQDEQAWIIEGAESYVDSEASGTIDFAYRIRFLADEGAQRARDERTVRIEIHHTAQNAGNYHPVDEDFDVDFDWATRTELVVLPRGAHGESVLEGMGTLDGTTSTHRATRTFSHEQSAEWQLALERFPGAPCPVGSMSGTLGEYTFSTEIDGAGGIHWLLTRLDETVGGESGAISCATLGG